MPNTFNYTVAFKGNIDGIKSVLEKDLKNEIKRVQENAITFSFDYKNFNDLQSKLDTIASQLDPTIGVQFRYEVNKKLKEQAEKELESLTSGILGKRDQKKIDAQIGVIDKINQEILRLESAGAKSDLFMGVNSSIKKLEEELAIAKRQITEMDNTLANSVSRDSYNALSDEFYILNEQIIELTERAADLERQLAIKDEFLHSTYLELDEVEKRLEESTHRAEAFKLQLIQIEETSAGINGSGTGKSGNGKYTFGFNEDSLNRIAMAIEYIQRAIGAVEDDNTLLSFLDQVNQSLVAMQTNLQNIEIKDPIINMQVDMGDNKNPEIEKFLRQRALVYRNAYERVFKDLSPDSIFSTLLDEQHTSIDELKSLYGQNTIVSMSNDLEGQINRIRNLLVLLDEAVKRRGDYTGDPFWEKLAGNMKNTRSASRNTSVFNRQLEAIRKESEEQIKGQVMSKINGEVSTDLTNIEEIVNSLNGIRTTLETIASENYLSQMLDMTIEKLRTFKNELSSIPLKIESNLFAYDNLPAITDEQGNTQKWYRGVRDTKVGFQSNADDGQTYWTTNREQAELYAGALGKVYEAEVRAANVLEIDAKGLFSEEVTYLDTTTQEAQSLYQSFVESKRILKECNEEYENLNRQRSSIAVMMNPEELRRVTLLADQKKQEIDQAFARTQALESQLSSYELVGTHEISSWAMQQGYDSVIFNNINTRIEETINGVIQTFERLGSDIVTTSSKQLLNLQVVPNSRNTKTQNDLEQQTQAQQQLNEAKEQGQQIDKNNSLSTKHIKSEIKKLEELNKTINNVTQSVNEKTNAFTNEKIAVEIAVKKELELLDDLKNKLDNIKDSAKIDVNINNTTSNSSSGKENNTTPKQEKTEESSKIEDAYNRLIKCEEKYQQLLNAKNNGKLNNAKQIVELEELSKQRKADIAIIKESSEVYEKYEAEISKITNRISALNDAQQKINSQNGLSKLGEDIKKTSELFENKSNIENQTTAYSEGISNLKNQLVTLKQIYDDLKVKDIVTPEDIQHVKDLNSQIYTSLQSLKNTPVNPAKISNIILQTNQWMQQNTKISAEAKSQLTEYIRLLSTIDDASKVPTLVKQINDVKNAEITAGRAGKSFFSLIKTSFTSLSRYLLTFASFYRIIGVIRSSINTIKELDTALVDLRKTTTMSTSELDGFYYSSNKIAKEMGVTTQEIINQASAFSRLGYSSKEAAEGMAQISSKFASISPDMDVSKATDGLVSIMKAFDIDVNTAERDILDNINRIGNTAATSNGEIVDMLTRSSAAMKEANNTLQETIALETAAIEVTRNAETTGTAFKTIAMRIRGKSLPPYTVMYMPCA